MDKLIHYELEAWNTETDLSRARTQLSREESTTGPSVVLAWQDPAGNGVPQAAAPHPE